MMTEWIDFPRSEQFLPDGKFVPGNNNSYDKCRRRFDLVSTIIQFICLVSKDTKVSFCKFIVALVSVLQYLRYFKLLIIIFLFQST